MEKKTVIIEVQTEDGVKQLDRLSAKFDEVYGDVLPLTASIGELEDQLYQMALEGKKGTEEFNLLAQEAGRLKKTLQQVDLEVDGLSMTTANKLGGALGGVTAGFELAQGAMGAMGVESEKVQEALLKVQSAMAMAQGIQGLKESAASFKALGASASAAFQGMSNGAKAFAATGIGLLVTAVAYLVANFDDLKDSFSSVSEGQKALNSTMDEYTNAATDATIKTNEVKNAFQLAKEGVISKGEALKKYNDTLGGTFGVASNLNEAEKLFVEKTEAYIKASALRAQADSILKMAAEEKVKAMIADIDAQKNAIKAAKEQENFVTGLVGNMTPKLQKASSDQAKIKAKELEDLSANLMKQAELIENNNGIKSESEQAYNSEVEAKRKENNQKAIDDTYDKNAKELEAYKQHQENMRAMQAAEDAWILEQENLANEAQASKDEKQRAHDEEMSAFRIGIWEYELAEEKRIEEEKIKAQEETEKRKKQIAASSLEATKSTLQGISDIIGAFAGKSKAQQKKAFEAQKKLNIAMATIDTIKGAVSAFTGMTATIPGPVGLALGAVAAAGVVASGVANVKKISSTQFDAGGSPSASTSSGGTSGSGAPNLPQSQPAQFNLVGNSGTNQLDGLEGSKPIKAYVVSGDVTSAQSLERNKIATATL